MGIFGGCRGTGVRIATASDRSRRNSRVIPRPVRRLVVGIRNTPAQIQRGTDCHSQCAHWLRNDREFYRGCGRAGRRGRRPLRKRILWCVGEGLSCPPLCRPIPGHCRVRQSGHFLETGLLHPPLAALRRFPLPRATARVAPTKALVGADDPVRPVPVTQHFVGQGPCALPWVRGERNPPVTALPCQPPLGKGAKGTGERIATASVYTGFAMTGSFTWGAVGGTMWASSPTGGTGGTMGGRPQGSPLRRVTRSACVRGRAAALHQGSFLQRSSVLWTTWATLWPRPG